MQDYGAAATYIWTPAAQGAYGLEVDVRDRGSAAPYDTHANSTFTIDSRCTSPSLAAVPVSPQGTGTRVVFNASTGACSSPLYRFWIAPPGAGWKIVQDYGAANSYALTATGAAGTYRAEVDVRDATSTAPYDHVANSAYVLTACGGARLATSMPTPQPVGSIIVLNGSASCLAAPTYRFWVRPPGGAWVIARDYSTAATYSWNTTGLARGVYGLEVDARDQGSTAPYETVANLSFLVDSCSGAALATSKQSPQPHGTTVVLTASASCLGTPQYRFWVRDTSGRWTIKQDFSTSNTFTWNTAGLAAGTYGLEVDVRDSGSSAPYETVANLTFAVT
jgi:hypothetical protein